MRNLLIFLFGPVLFVFGQGVDDFKGKDQNKSYSHRSWRESYFAGEPLRFGNRVQFLFDDYAVEDKFGLKRIIGPVEKFSGNPLTIGHDMPWESASTSWRGVELRHIIYDPQEKLYKGWYLIYRREPGFETGYNYATLYTESTDGITWVKPELDLFPFLGQKTNIVLHKEKGTAMLEEVVLDSATADPTRRYTGLAKMIPPGEKVRCIVRMFSPDGKKWTLAPDPVLTRGANDGSYSLVRDAERGGWLLFRRSTTHALIQEKDGFYAGRNVKRRFSVTTSKDMKQWSYPRNIVLLDEVDDSKLETIGNKMDIDWAQVTKYQDFFLGFLSLMDNLTISVPRRSHLMWSRDGFDWERLPERPFFIENGKPGEWDSGSIGGYCLIPYGDRYRIYYGGANTTQGFYGCEGEKDIPRFLGTGLAFIGRDRFIGLQAGPEGGYLLSRQFVLEGDRIEINCRSAVQKPPPGWGSLIKAELLQPPEEHFTAMPYPGFTMKECDPIMVNDELQQIVTWNGNADLSKLRGKRVYIRFYIRNSILYTFQVVNSH